LLRGFSGNIPIKAGELQRYSNLYLGEGIVGRSTIHKKLTELGYELQETQVTTEITRLRGKLRKLLGIKDGFDPVPTTTGHSDRAAAWTVYVPSWL